MERRNTGAEGCELYVRELSRQLEAMRSLRGSVEPFLRGAFENELRQAVDDYREGICEIVAGLTERLGGAAAVGEKTAKTAETFGEYTLHENPIA